jgi:hypothetical protein
LSFGYDESSKKDGIPKRVHAFVAWLFTITATQTPRVALGLATLTPTTPDWATTSFSRVGWNFQVKEIEVFEITG